MLAESDAEWQSCKKALYEEGLVRPSRNLACRPYGTLLQEEGLFASPLVGEAARSAGEGDIINS